MRNVMAAGLTLGLLAAVPGGVRAAAEDAPKTTGESGVARAHVQVRVYDTGVMPAADQTVALRAAAGVLAAAGIDVAWLRCGNDPAGGHAAACDIPLGRAELSVRLVRLPGAPSAHGQLQLGYSLVDMQLGEGRLATMYVDRVQWLAAGAHADAAVLLGFATAHEIGHLLLGTTTHAAHGLMRAVWSRDELQHAETTDWLFSRDEAAKMQAALEQRNGLRSSQRDASGCSASGGDAPDASTACGATAALASLRAVAAGADR